MNQNKLYELKQRAKSAFGITQMQLNRKSKMNLSSSAAEDSIKIINSMKSKEKYYKPKSGIKNPQINVLKKMKEKARLELGYSAKKNEIENLNQYSDKGTYYKFGKYEYQ